MYNLHYSCCINFSTIKIDDEGDDGWCFNGNLEAGIQYWLKNIGKKVRKERFKVGLRRTSDVNVISVNKLLRRLWVHRRGGT